MSRSLIDAAASAAAASKPGSGRRRPTRVRRSGPGGIVATAILIVGALGMVAPFLWMFATSMRPATEAYDLPPKWLPFPLQSEN